MPICRQSDPLKALAKPVSQIQTWIIERLAHRGFEQPNNTGQVDLWPFFMCLGNYSLWYSSSYVSRYTAAALEICGLSIKEEDVKVSSQEVLFCYMMHYIPSWLADTALLGRYAITGERYTVPLLCASRYILRLTNCRLEAICKDNLLSMSVTMLLARNTFCRCISYLPLSIELYFFVLYMYSVIMSPRDPWPKGGIMARFAWDYLLKVSLQRTFAVDIALLTRFKQMREAFPFLSDTASPEYVSAQESAEADWIETKGGLYDPILSIRLSKSD